MNKIFIVFLIGSVLSQSACTQPIEKNLVGSWALNSSYEFPDIIIFRSDHKYFVYNANSVAAESLGRVDNLKSGDILINDAYTSMTERGVWDYDESSKELILKDRNILEDASDFSKAYGSSGEVIFSLKQLAENEIEICYKKQGKQLCDNYEKNWSYTTKDDVQIAYREFVGEYSDIGTQTKEILLSGYETELKLTYDFYKEQHQLVVEDGRGKELFATGMLATNGRKMAEITLRGVTKLVLKVKGIQSDSKWWFKVEIK